MPLTAAPPSCLVCPRIRQEPSPKTSRPRHVPSHHHHHHSSTTTNTYLKWTRRGLDRRPTLQTNGEIRHGANKTQQQGANHENKEMAVLACVCHGLTDCRGGSGRDQQRDRTSSATVHGQPGHVQRTDGHHQQAVTAITETPRSISVVTADRMRDQGVQTVQDALRYVSGVRGEAYGLDARGDSALIRGSRPTLFLDGLQQSFGSYTNTRPDPFTLERIEVLKGPASMLYGQSPVGGLINMVSKRPQPRQQTELQLQYGTHDRKQVAFDSTGPLTEDGNWLYRIVAIARDSGTQVDHVDDDRLVLMPSITWQPTDDLEWTLLANIQRDDSGSTSQFLPHTGTLLGAPYGRFDTDLFVSEPGFDEYNTEQLALTSMLSWRLNETWTLRQNLRYQQSEVSYQQIYGWPPVLAADNRTLNRIYYVSKPEVDVWAADQSAQALFDTGAFQHTLLVGADYQHAVTNRDQAGGLARPSICITRSMAPSTRRSSTSPPIPSRRLPSAGSTCRTRSAISAGC